MKKNFTKLLSCFAIGLGASSLAPATLALTSCGNTDTKDLLISEFKKLTQIPRNSDKILKDVPYTQGNVWNMSCYLKNRFEQITGLPNIFQDKYGNLVFDVPCNNDACKNFPKVALQAHMDMVFAYDPDQFDYEPDSKTTKIDLVDETIDGKRILHSRDYKTSIGGDNGMGVAQLLAMLQNKSIKHGDLRIIVTNCEENALQGAGLLCSETYKNVLKDIQYVLNIDGEDEGQVFVASSGSVGSYYNIEYDKLDPKADYTKAFKLSISGFEGGHSGGDIHLRRVNALKYVTDVLTNINGKLDSDDKKIVLSSISTPGITVYNSIPTSCEVVFAIKSNVSVTEVSINQAVIDVNTQYTNETIPGDNRTDKHKYSADELNKKVVKIEDVTSSIDKLNFISVEQTKKILELQSKLQYGISKWPSDEDSEKLVGEQTSANIGPVSLKVDANGKMAYSLASYSRSNVDTDIDNFRTSNMNDVTILNEYAEDGKVINAGRYTNDAQCYGWQQDSNKKLMNLCKEGWIKAGLKEENVSFQRTHGALECSWWHKAMNNSNSAIVSFGPTIKNVHKPTETVYVDTVNTCLATTIYMLANLDKLAD